MASWTVVRAKGSLPSARHGHGAALYEKKLVIFGGGDETQSFNDIFLLNTAGLMSWAAPKCTGVLPPPCCRHTITLVGEKKLFVFGGRNAEDDSCSSNFAVLDLEKLTWSRPRMGGDEPTPRAGHTGTLVGASIYYLGGEFKRPIPFQPLVADTAKSTWSQIQASGTPPSSRHGHSATAVGTQIYCFGGVSVPDGLHLMDMHVLDTDNMTWTSPELSGCVPSPRMNHDTILCGNYVYLFGGRDSGRDFNDLFVLDPDSMVWCRYGPEEGNTKWPSARSGHAIALFGTKILVSGGKTEEGYVNDTLSIDTTKADKEMKLNGVWEADELARQAAIVAANATDAGAGAVVPRGSVAAPSQQGKATTTVAPAQPGALDVSQIQELERRAAQLEKRAVDAENGYSDLQMSLKELEAEAAQAERKAKEVEDNVSTIETQKEDARQKVIDETERLQQATAAVKDAEGMLKEWDKRQKKKVSQGADADKRVAGAEEEVKELQKRLALVKDNSASLSDRGVSSPELDSKRKELAKSHSQLEEANKQKEQHVAGAMAQIAETSEKLEKLEARFEQEVQRLKNQVETLENASTTAEETVKQLQDAEQALAAQVATVNGKIDDLTTETCNVVAQAELVKSKIAEKATKVETVTKEVEHLREKSSNRSMKVAGLQARVAEAGEKAFTNNLEISKLKAELDHNIRTKCEKEAEKAEWVKKIETLEKELEEIRGERSDAQATLKEWGVVLKEQYDDLEDISKCVDDVLDKISGEEQVEDQVVQTSLTQFHDVLEKLLTQLL